MKARELATDGEVATLVRAFDATIPAFEFTLTAHIAVALSYVGNPRQVVK